MSNDKFESEAPGSGESDEQILAGVGSDNPIRMWIKISSRDRVVIETPEGLIILYGGEDVRP